MTSGGLRILRFAFGFGYWVRFVHAFATLVYRPCCLDVSNTKDLRSHLITRHASGHIQNPHRGRVLRRWSSGPGIPNRPFEV